MSAAAKQLLVAFDSLPADDREGVVAELLMRHPIGEGDLPDEARVELADELFHAYDAEEASDATPPR